MIRQYNIENVYVLLSRFKHSLSIRQMGVLNSVNKDFVFMKCCVL